MNLLHGDYQSLWRRYIIVCSRTLKSLDEGIISLTIFGMWDGSFFGIFPTRYVFRFMSKWGWLVLSSHLGFVFLGNISWKKISSQSMRVCMSWILKNNIHFHIEVKWSLRLWEVCDCDISCSSRNVYPNRGIMQRNEMETFDRGSEWNIVGKYGAYLMLLGCDILCRMDYIP